MGDEPGRTVRRLAHGRRRLRILLRLHRRRGEPVVPDALRGHHAGRAEEDARRGLPLHGGHDRQGHGLDRAAEGPRARQALLRVLRARRHPCAPPRAQGMGRQVQGQVRPGLGQAARRDLCPAEGSSASSRRTAGSPRATRRFLPGTTCRRRSSPCCAGRWRSTRASWSTPTTTWAVCSMAWRSSASSTTRWSTTSSATTAPRPRVRSTAPSTRCSTSTAWPPSRRRSSSTPGSTSSADPKSYNHYAVGWAHAMDTPYQWTKQVASHWGGTRNGTIVHWPKGIKAKGEMRWQFHHVIDVAPTVLDAAGLPEPIFGERRAAAAHRGREHALLLQRRQGPRAARDPVLRDVRQPRHLPQGLDRGDAAQDALDAHRREDPRLRRRRLGALRHGQGLEPGERPVQADAGEAPRAAAPVAHRGGQVQRAAPR